MISLLQQCDDKLFLLINSHHHIAADCFFWLVTWLGNGWIVTPILLVITFVKVPRNRLPHFIIISALGMIASGLLNSGIKDITHRPRPLSYFSSYKESNTGVARSAVAVHVVGEPLSSRAFPSGHSNTAFSAATLVGFSFGGWYWLAFVAAALVGYSRIYMGAHFPLDVIAGAVLGILVMAVTAFMYKWIFPERS